MYVLGNDSVFGQEKGHFYGRWKVDGELGQEKGHFYGHWKIDSELGQEKGCFYGRFGKSYKLRPSTEAFLSYQIELSKMLKDNI